MRPTPFQQEPIHAHRLRSDRYPYVLFFVMRRPVLAGGGLCCSDVTKSQESAAKSSPKTQLVDRGTFE